MRLNDIFNFFKMIGSNFSRFFANEQLANIIDTQDGSIKRAGLVVKRIYFPHPEKMTFKFLINGLVVAKNRGVYNNGLFRQAIEPAKHPGQIAFLSESTRKPDWAHCSGKFLIHVQPDAYN
jgi:hypothetical protein